MRVIISGGGTGGHVFPAIAIANAIKEKEPSAEILFVGAENKLEMEKVPKAGYPIEGLWISGIDRKLTLRNFVFPFKLLSSLWKSARIIKKFNPDVAIGVGGYASGPLLYQASRKGIPTIIQEQNSYPGITNRLLAKRADKICVAYSGMNKFFPEEKITLTGNPVRKEIFENKKVKEEVLRGLGLDPDKKTVLIFGGSLGARTINDAVSTSMHLIKPRDDINWIWQAGKLYIQEFEKCEVARLGNVKVMAFIDDMPGVYEAADIVVCRAGALTISELQVAGKAAILVPSPNVAEDHQTMNAKALVDQGAALMVKDKEAKNEMIKEVLTLLDNNEDCRRLSEKILTLGKKDAAMKIAEEVFELIKK